MTGYTHVSGSPENKMFTIAARFCLGSLDTCILVVAYGIVIVKRITSITGMNKCHYPNHIERRHLSQRHSNRHRSRCFKRCILSILTSTAVDMHSIRDGDL